MSIHPTAIVHSGARLGSDVEIGPYSIIEEQTSIGDGARIDSHVLIGKGTTMGANCRIHQGAVIGSEPQDLKFDNEESYAVIGGDNVFREYVTVNRATENGESTVIGDGNFLMAYVHVAHNCIVGNHIIMANAVTLAGHVEIEDHAIIGGLTPVHQFVRIGRHSFIGGGSRIVKDVLPYILVAGNPPRPGGLNIVGLQRRDFSDATCEILHAAYRLLFRTGLNTSQAVEKIGEALPEMPEVRNILDFIAKSRRGITK